VGLTLGLGLGVAEGDGGGDVGDGRASVEVGVGAAVLATWDVAGGVTDTGVQPAMTTIATAQKRTDHALMIIQSDRISAVCR
jgi:hypothetical protein